MQISENDQLLMRWDEAKKALDIAKNLENELRREVLQRFFNFNFEVREGTENVELGQGYKLKSTFSTNRKLDKEKLGSVLDKMEKTKEGKLIAERLIKWKAELSVSEYKQLPDKYKNMIDEVITLKPATPQIEIKAPKGQ